MGREAYLARLALGISAFQEPLRDENGDFVLGGQAHKFDNIGYVQQWDERGYPQNPISQRQAKRFDRSQNEILQACGLVVRKNAEEKKKKRRGDEISESFQLKIVEEENETGFLLKFFDNLAGDLLTWWIRSLKKRLLVFKQAHPTILATVKAGLCPSTAISFLFGGFSACTIETLIRADIEVSEYIDFLETRPQRSPESWEAKIKTWGKWLLLLSVETSLSMISTLQSLGFTIAPAILSYLRSTRRSESASFFTINGATATEGLIGLFILHLVRGQIRNGIFWRSYLMLRQILPRPRNPSKVSVQAAENSEFDDGWKIVGIGRSLGSNTNRRFYGPQSLWPALQVAFPWVKFFDKNKIDRDKIKHETLTRCAMMEDGQEHHDVRKRRVENIISNLESLGIDFEEDFFVDIDQWSQEIDGIETEGIFDDALLLEVENAPNQAQEEEAAPDNEMLGPESSNIQRRPSLPLPNTQNSYNIIEHPDGSIAIEIQLSHDDARNQSHDMRMAPVEVLSFPTSPQNEATTATEVPAAQPTAERPSHREEVNITSESAVPNGQPIEPVQAAQIATTNVAHNTHDQHTPPVTTSEMGQPLTPEPGIRRATSLSHTQTTPRPVRRSTETRDYTNVEDYLAEVLAGARRLEAKKKTRDNRESRVTRLSVFAADCFAAHMSYVITDILLLPLNAFYYRKLTQWFLSTTKSLPTTVSVFSETETQLIESCYSWSQGRMVLLSVGIECLIHGAVWQVGCGIARYYGRMYHWGVF